LAAVYTSPLVRARETAEVIARTCGLEVCVNEAFVDMDFGDWQGLPLTEVEKRFPELYQTWRTTPAEARIPGAESLVEVKKRAVAAITALAGAPRYHGSARAGRPADAERGPWSQAPAGQEKRSLPEAALCVVTHRVVSKLVMAWALGLDEAAFWRIRQDTACLNAFEYDGREEAQPPLACCRPVPGATNRRGASVREGPGPRGAGPVVHLLNDTCHLTAVAEGKKQADF
jgi:broad specificity phosphatase PhoE